MYFCHLFGALAQLARVLDWQSKGRGFDSHTLHKNCRSGIYAYLVKFKPIATILSGLFFGAFDFEATLVPYPRPNLGIPIEIQLAYINGRYN